MLTVDIPTLISGIAKKLGNHHPIASFCISELGDKNEKNGGNHWKYETAYY